jgi:phenolic acid decarboxylase
VGKHFFPRWIAPESKKFIGFQNEKIDLMRQYRDAGPTCPPLLVGEFADITFVEGCGLDDESVIACAPGDLPPGYATPRNVG